jgi:protein-S-isoprenylcysteine O-methyltransferase Ste14
MWGVSKLGLQLSIAPTLKHLAVVVLAITGMTFDLLGLLAFRVARTTVNPLKPQSTTVLVTSGVYRITRNPMYVGMLLFLLAWAVFFIHATVAARPIGVCWLYHPVSDSTRRACAQDTFRRGVH